VNPFSFFALCAAAGAFELQVCVGVVPSRTKRDSVEPDVVWSLATRKLEDRALVAYAVGLGMPVTKIYDAVQACI